MNAPQRVISILEPLAKDYHPEAVVVAPLMVWDVNDRSMGVMIKAPKMMRDTPCEMRVSFVLTPQEYANDTTIRQRGAAAMLAFRHTLMSQVKAAKKVEAA